MEILLNAAWLLISLTALGMWLAGRRYQHDRVWGSLVLLGCALVLLFPVVSMTDDLRCGQMTMDDDSLTSKRVLKAADVSKAAQSHLALAIPASAHVEGQQWQVVGYVALPVQFPLNSSSTPHNDGRAPPSFS